MLLVRVKRVRFVFPHIAQHLPSYSGLAILVWIQRVLSFLILVAKQVSYTSSVYSKNCCSFISPGLTGKVSIYTNVVNRHQLILFCSLFPGHTVVWDPSARIKHPFFGGEPGGFHDISKKAMDLWLYRNTHVLQNDDHPHIQNGAAGISSAQSFSVSPP